MMKVLIVEDNPAMRRLLQWQSPFDFRKGQSFYGLVQAIFEGRLEFGLAGRAGNTALMAACPSSFTVNDPGDTSDAGAGDQVCADSNGNCTLRAAIQEANAITACSPLTINFSVTGTINLATVLPSLNHPNLTISGPGASSLTVQRSTAAGTGLFRVFKINSGMTVAVSGMTITNGMEGSIVGNGAGINNAGTLSLSDCVISGNNTGGGSSGGGIYTQGPLTVTRCAINGNDAGLGAGIRVSSTTLVMSDSTISGNGAIYPGGGLYMDAATVMVTNCAFSGNKANGNFGSVTNTGVGGETSLLTLVNCTITGATGNSGVGISTRDSSNNATSIVTRLKNTLVAGNGGNNFATSGTNATLTSQGANLDSDGSSGFTGGVNGDLVGAAANKIDALLSSLGSYGGATQTHALLPGSPAINAGASSGAPANDQRGSSRVGAVDIGSFESQGFSLTIAGGNNQNTAFNTAFTNPLSVAVTANAAAEPVNGGQVTFTPPTQPGSFPIIVTATDSNGCTGTGATYRLSVYTTSMLAPAPTREILYY